MMQESSICRALPARRLPAALLCLLGIAAFMPAAHAQRVYLGGLRDMHLSRQDAHAFLAGAQHLLERNPARVGQTQAWSGPDGVRGTMTIRGLYEKSGMPCRDVHSTFVGKDAGQQRQYDFKVCRTPAGDWKLAG